MAFRRLQTMDLDPLPPVYPEPLLDLFDFIQRHGKIVRRVHVDQKEPELLVLVSQSRLTWDGVAHGHAGDRVTKAEELAIQVHQFPGDLEIVRGDRERDVLVAQVCLHLFWYQESIEQLTHVLDEFIQVMWIDRAASASRDRQDRAS